MNLVLIGYRGTGKSAAGKIAAPRLGLTYRCMDAEIAAAAAKSIPQIVQALGWPGFRDLETRLALALAAEDRLLIDTGGGIIERPENIAALRRNGCIVWLQASVAAIVDRIHGDTQRPALTPGRSFTEEVAAVLEQRREKYRAAAHIAIDTDGATVRQVADQVVAAWRSAGQ